MRLLAGRRHVRCGAVVQSLNTRGDLPTGQGLGFRPAPCVLVRSPHCANGRRFQRICTSVSLCEVKTFSQKPQSVARILEKEMMSVSTVCQTPTPGLPRAMFFRPLGKCRPRLHLAKEDNTFTPARFTAGLAFPREQAAVTRHSHFTVF